MPSADLPDRPLTVPLLIRGSFDNGLFVLCCVISTICCIVSAMMLRGGDLPAAVAVLTVAVATGVPGLIMGLWLRYQREWIEVTLTGFVLTRRGQRRVYTDEQLVGLSQQIGRLPDGSARHRLVLEIAADETERIDCRYPVPNSQTDPLATFVERLVDGLAAKAERDNKGEWMLTGEGWTLDGGVLRRRREAYPLDAVTCMGFYDGHLCLWRGDEERPFLRLGQGTRNALALGALVAKRLRERADQGGPVLPLGRLLLERRSWGLLLGLLVTVVFIPAAFTFLMMGYNAPPLDKPNVVSPFLVCVSLAGVGLVVAWCGRFGHLRFHERGVWQSGKMGERRLLYEEIGAVTWKKGPVLVLAPRPGLGLRSIVFRTVTGAFDPELAAMRDFACWEMARQWEARQPHEPVPWTARLRFLPGGLEYRTMTLLGLSDPMSVPYHCCHYRIELNQFVLLTGEGQGQVVFKERIDGVNFFVGLLVFDAMRRRYQGDDLPDAGGHVPKPEAATAGADERVKGAARPGVRQGREQT